MNLSQVNSLPSGTAADLFLKFGSDSSAISSFKSPLYHSWASRASGLSNSVSFSAQEYISNRNDLVIESLDRETEQSVSLERS